MISKEEIEHLAVLARLELSDSEAVSLQKDISNILEYVGQVSDVSTDGAAPEAGSNRNSMRQDLPRTEDDPLSDKREALLQALPKREGDYAVVRKIIEKDSE